MTPYVGWGCPTCEVGNPATRKRCKKCGRKRPEKYTLTTFQRPPRINKPKGRSKAMPKVFKQIYRGRKKDIIIGTRSGRLSSKGAGVQNIPRTLPVETKLAAKYSDGALAELQKDGDITCTCEEYQKTNGCRHKSSLSEFVRSTPPQKKEA